MVRTLSGGLSIGTGIMLEALFKMEDRYDESRDYPKKVDINKYDNHVYSIHTIIRNVLSSLPKPNKGLETKDLKNIIVDEINLIHSYYDNVKCKPLLSIVNYDRLCNDFNSKKDVKYTKNILHLLELNDWIKKSNLVYEKGIVMDIISSKLKLESNKTIITTSFLLDFTIYGLCDLLESHTGKLKTKHNLNTKFHPVGKRDLSHLPYIKIIHKILGDKTYVAPVKISDRIRLLELAEKWNVRTTESRVKEAVLKTPELKKYI